MNFAQIVWGLVAEIIVLPRAEVDLLGPAEGDAEPVLIVKAGDEIPISLCYHPDYVATCVPIPEGTTVAIGDRWSEGQGFSGPPPALEAALVPASVTMRQARLALLSAGKLAAVSAAINGLSSPQKEAAQIEWEFAATVDRASPFLANLAALLQLDDQALDDLFISAAQL
ncbi:hypothetical protein [Variovorax sp. RCC_210]|uniref:hypothetical protein n=1 Tax=Variovorax sp. RCC_210 TaxID=3239217 RepID=UPI0035246AE2